VINNFGEDSIEFKGMMLKAAEKKSANEQCILAEGYALGYGDVKKDLHMAFMLYQMAAPKNKTAKYNLAGMYLRGEGTQKDISKALQLFEELAKSNDIPSIQMLANLYYFGEFGVKQDYVKSKRYHEILAKKGESEALCSLGYMYEYGLGTKIDNIKAIDCYAKAADKGNYVAKYNLGCAYFDGRIVEQDYKKSYDYLVDAVKANYAPAKYSLGYMYYTGRGVDVDLNKAKELFLDAAKQNESQSLYMLAYMYNLGKGVEVDHKKAIEYYEKSAKYGNIEAYADLGFMYNEGRGVDVDHKKALEYFEKGIKLGSNTAKCNMAVAYVNGNGVEIDRDKAIEILNSADDNFIHKHYFLGVIKKDCISQEKTTELINDAIYHFDKYVEMSKTADEARYLPIVYYMLYESYLELYYLDQANEKARTKQYFLQTNTNREKAKYYLQQAQNIKHTLDSDLVAKNLENDLRIAEDLINDSGLDFSKFSYEEFKEQFFGKHENLFLLTHKKEYELFDDGIKHYFEKRVKNGEIKKKLDLEQSNFEKRKSLIRKKLEEMGVENIDEKLEEIRLSQLEKIQNEEVDFSNTVINIDKYLEEIIHFLFVDCMYDHKNKLYKQVIENDINQIKSLLLNCSPEMLKELNLILNGIDKSVNLKDEARIKKLEIFTDKFNKNWKIKNVAEENIENLNSYFEAEKDNLNKTEKTLIEKMLETAEARKELGGLQKQETFELGSLFYMAFNDASTSNDMVAQKVVDPAFVEFVTSVNDKLSFNEASLKLKEFLVKVEMFRVIVRNVASHKSILMQSAVEHGINISVVQENSIFKLLDEMFGDFLNKKYVDKMVEDIDLSI